MIKRPFLPDKMQKRDIKTPPAWRINIHASTERPCTDPGSAPLPHSGLRGAYTRVLSGYPSLFGQKKSLS